MTPRDKRVRGIALCGCLGLLVAVAVGRSDGPAPFGNGPGQLLLLPAGPVATPEPARSGPGAPTEPGSAALRILLGAPLGLPAGRAARGASRAPATVGTEPLASEPDRAAQNAARDAARNAARVRAVNREATALLTRPPLSSPITKTITPGAPDVSLDAGRDYVLKVRSGTVFTRPVTITGGHNVVLENLVIKYAAPLGALPGWKARGLLLQDQTGVMWVDNIHIRGPLAEGIDLSQKKSAAVVLRTIAIDPVDGSESTNHADLLQTWAGPGRLVVDGLTGTSDFQGVFLQPDDTWDGPDPKFIVLRNVHIDVSKGIYALSSYAHGAYPVLADNVSVRYNPARPSRDQWLWPKPSTGDTTWSKVIGIGPGGGGS